VSLLPSSWVHSLHRAGAACPTRRHRGAIVPKPQLGEILSFDLPFKNLIHLANYIVYTNQSDYLDDKQLAEDAANLAKIREEYGLEVDVRLCAFPVGRESAGTPWVTGGRPSRERVKRRKDADARA
jgi:hypothetical protein